RSAGHHWAVLLTASGQLHGAITGQFLLAAVNVSATLRRHSASSCMTVPSENADVRTSVLARSLLVIERVGGSVTRLGTAVGAPSDERVVGCARSGCPLDHPDYASADVAEAATGVGDGDLGDPVGGQLGPPDPLCPAGGDDLDSAVRGARSGSGL